MKEYKKRKKLIFIIGWALVSEGFIASILSGLAFTYMHSTNAGLALVPICIVTTMIGLHYLDWSVN